MQLDDNHIKNLEQDFRNYIKARAEKAYFQVGKDVSDAWGKSVFKIILVVFAFFAFLFLNIGLGFGIGEWLERTPAIGFLILGGAYFLLMLIFCLFKKLTIARASHKIASKFVTLSDKLMGDDQEDENKKQNDLRKTFNQMAQKAEDAVEEVIEEGKEVLRGK